ncbi:UPF0149 family protein [Natronospira proteinivora]|nr:UPF0149 family protein [Natronospira proteinivora]
MPRFSKGDAVSLPSHNEFARILKQAEALSEAAESHGTLTGLLAAAPEGDWRQQWLALCLQGGDQQGTVPLSANARPLFDQAYDTTQASLADLRMSFEPLLPGDDSPMAERVHALGQWCQGFLYGFSVARPGGHEGLPPQVKEVLDDMTRLAQVEAPDSQGDEGDESALTEIVEYVRVAAQLVHDELRLKDPAPPNRTRH